MKKMILSLLAIAAMTSCTTTSEDEIDPNAPVEIKLSAGIGTVEAIGRAAIPSTLTTDLNVFLHDLQMLVMQIGPPVQQSYSQK